MAENTPDAITLPSEWNWERILREEQEETGSTIKLSTDLNKQIRTFKGQVGIFKKNPSPGNFQNLQNRDALLSQDIQNFLENDLPDEPEGSNTNNPPSMTPEEQALIERAKAVGLPETATEAEITAAEKTAQEQADAAAAAQKKADDDAAAAQKKADDEAREKSAKPKSGGIGQYFGMDDDD